MRLLFPIVGFALLAFSIPSFGEKLKDEIEELAAEKMEAVISRLDALSKKLEMQMEAVEALNQEKAEE
ncbi:MAG: hypothetical protein KDK44_02385 [Chlamydiia bacterium]|nr:hypothetical protein [Chlamydiia bacterium]MCP5509517.1 hypothetical protein [Chlamydiales bacterium]HPE84867.1 hypothetical protein [Chlamydiales bacterium]